MQNIWAERKLNKAKNKHITLKKIKGKLVVITNIETNVSTNYISISEAALALNITRTTLRNYVKKQRVFTLLKREEKSVIKENLLITVKDY
jgi:hypothetical protein